MPKRTFELIRTDEGFFGLEADWNGLWESLPAPSPYLSHDWVAMCWRFAGLRRPASRRIAIVREDGELAAVLPLTARRRYGLLREYRPLTSLMPQYTDALLRNDADAAARAACLLHGLAPGLGVSRLVLGHVPDDSALLPALRGARRHHWGDTVGADLSAGFDGYLARLDPALRSDHRRRLRLLRAAGGYELRLSDRSTIDADFNWLLAQKRRWEPPRGKRRRWVDDLASENSLREFSHRWLDKGRLWLAMLSLGDAPIASSLYFAGGSTLWAFMITLDPAHKRFAPGRTLQLMTMERAAAAGFACVDFMWRRVPDWRDRLKTTEAPIQSVRAFLRPGETS
ncbi:MAG TPA: GNAT family N-acetyltransferase [Devosia sp.]|nr:GNAT family N-acetyltransferase [Devosia sp.]